jgi:hypothetical protein
VVVYIAEGIHSGWARYMCKKIKKCIYVLFLNLINLSCIIFITNNNSVKLERLSAFEKVMPEDFKWCFKKKMW